MKMKTTAAWSSMAMILLMHGISVPSASAQITAQSAAPRPMPLMRPMALSGTGGDLGPGLGPGVLFSTFATADETSATPAINRRGKSIFVATLIGPGIDATNDTGIWVERAGQLFMLARTGDPAPGTAPGITFAAFHRQPVLSASGEAAFAAVIAGPGVTNDNNDGLWTEGNGTLDLLLRERTTPVPGGGSGEFGDPSQPGNPTPTMWYGLPSINADGRVLVSVILTDPVGMIGTYSDRFGALAEVVRRDTVVPGLEPRTFGAVARSPGFSDSGAVAFYGVTTTPFPQYRGFWSDRSGTIASVVITGDPAPGTTSTFTSPMGVIPAINGADRVAFTASVNGGNSDGIWSEGLYGVVQLIALEDHAAPGTPDTFFQFDDPVLGDNNGTTAFTATVSSPTLNRGVWSNRAGFLELVARAGEPVPGVVGATFGDFFALAINASGEVSFFSTTSTGKVLCRQGRDGVLSTIVSEFTMLDLFGNGTDVRLTTEVVIPPVRFVNEPEAAGTGDGRRIAFNDAGKVVVRLKFSDGSEGVFATNY